VHRFSKAFGRPIDAIDSQTIADLQAYPWPGNIRELRNVIERAMIIAAGPRLSIELPKRTTMPAAQSSKLADVQREHVLRVLESCDWKIRGLNGAAERLGLRPTTLETRMAKLGLARPRSA